MDVNIVSAAVAALFADPSAFIGNEIFRVDTAASQKVCSVFKRIILFSMASLILVFAV